MNKRTFISTIREDFLREKCGVVAVWDGKRDAPFIAKRALQALQHRGQESAGITVFKQKKSLVTHKAMGLIAQALHDKTLKKLGKAKSAIAHNRYSTTGNSSLLNSQPIFIKNRKFSISIGHNGNIPDLDYLISHVKNKPKETSDTALLAALLLQNRHEYASWIESLQMTLPQIRGAYCLVILTEDGSIYAARDPYGVRPLCIGKSQEGWVIASESVALDAAGAHFIREVKRGEILHISPEGKLSSAFFGEPKAQQFCLFEHIYFSRPDSFINGKRVKAGREALGRKLAQRVHKKGIKPDVIVPIFYSGYYAAKGAAAELGIPIVEAVVTSNYIGRTFIRPAQAKRVNAVTGKHNFIPDDVLNKRVLFVDDSIVRSTTSKMLVKGLYEAGAKEVYAGVASPPVVNPCDLGIDMKSKEELAASAWEHEPLEVIEKNMAKLIGAKGVIYLSLSDTVKALDGEEDNFYSHYFGGNHPLRGKQKKFRSNTKIIPERPRLTILTQDNWENVNKLLAAIKTKKLKGEIVDIMVDKSSPKSNLWIKKQNIPLINLNIKDISNNYLLRQEYERRVLSQLQKNNSNILLLLKWPFILSDEFLEETKKHEITVVNICPSLLHNENINEMTTSRGKIQILRGLNGFSNALRNNLPVSGITVHQVLPKWQVNTGPIILQEEIRLTKNLSTLQKEKKFKEIESRIFLTAMSFLLHILHHNINISEGKYPW